MKLKLTKKQILSAQKLLTELKEFSNKGYGSINKLIILKNNMLTDNIIIKYDKMYVMGGEPEYEYPIAAIDPSGQISFIEKNFKDIFQKSAFLSECNPIDIENPKDYELIE